MALEYEEATITIIVKIITITIIITVTMITMIIIITLTIITIIVISENESQTGCHSLAN